MPAPLPSLVRGFIRLPPGVLLHCAGEFGQDRALLDSSYNIFPCKAALYNLLSGSGLPYLYASTVNAMLGVLPLQHVMVQLPLPVESLRERFNLGGVFFRTMRDLAMAPFFGNSVACRLADAHEIKHSTLVLGDWRAAQRIEFEIGGEQEQDEDGQPRAVAPQAANGEPAPRYKVWVVNVHLDHAHPDVRQRQGAAVAEWMEGARDEVAAVVLCGDFNASPHEPLHQVLQRKGYRSSHAERHGCEPAVTHPTGIQAPLMDHAHPDCLDYVYVWAAHGYQLEVLQAQVYGDKPEAHDSTLYPSDHAAVAVELELRKIAPALKH